MPGAMVLVLAPSIVAAQPAWPGRGVITFNAGVQATSTSFTDRFTFEQYLEPATVETSYEVSSGPLFDGGATVAVWRGLGVGVAISRFSDRGTARVAAAIPHPFHFNRPRAIEGDARRVQRHETSVHVQIAWTATTTPRVRFTLFAGPSWISVEQSVVRQVRYAETYPFDTAEFTVTELERESASGAGFHAGVDLVWAFSKNVGVGGLLRFAHATATVHPGEGRALDLDAGGLHAGSGIRILF